MKNNRCRRIFIGFIVAFYSLLFVGCQSRPEGKTTFKDKTEQVNKNSYRGPELKVIDANPYYVELLGWLKIPFVVQNNGKTDVYNIKVDALAYDSKGKTLATTSSNDKYRLAPPEKVNPSTIAPGAKGYGILCLGNIREYGGIRFEVAAAQRPKSSRNKQLQVVEHEIKEGHLESAKGTAITKTVFGTVKNNTGEGVQNVFISIAGFDKDGKIVDFIKGKAEMGEISPGSTSSFSIDFEENRPIANYEIVSAEGVSTSKNQ